MRTTIRLPDDLLRQAKARAAAEGQTLNAVIELAVRDWLTPTQVAPRPRLPLPSWGDATGGLQPGIDLDDNASVLDAMEEGLTLDQLR